MSIRVRPVMPAIRMERINYRLAVQFSPVNIKLRYMRYGLFVFFILFISTPARLYAQVVLEKGTVSYVSSQNVYVKFSSTQSIDIGDTLFIPKNENQIPALVVTNKSSVSCVCSRLITDVFRVGDAIVAKSAPLEKKEAAKNEKPDKKNAAAKPAPAGDKTNKASADQPNNTKTEKKKSGQKVSVRLSAASYTNLSDRGDHTRMRYSLNMRGNHIKNSPFSTDAYITFRHVLNEWDSTRRNLNDALKIYSLSVKYDLNETSNLVLGRKINPKISSLGAVDGLQYEQGLGHFLVGAIAGARPDLRDYRLNPNLLQAGLYVGHDSRNNDKYQQTTLGIIEQHNGSAIDRRFIYVQHSDELLHNLNLFGSCEMDLYQKRNGETQNNLSLTNLFISLQYRLSRKVNVSMSYDNRKNIIYYESYKSYIDQLIDDETRQGLRFGLNVRPWKLVSLGANASWRFQKSSANDSKNLNAYLNLNRIPFLNTSVSLSANFLQTGYLNSTMYGARLMKDFFKGRASAELYYRWLTYDYRAYDYSTSQHVVGGSLSFQIIKGLSVYFFTEQTFDSQNNNYTLINSKIMQRF